MRSISYRCSAVPTLARPTRISWRCQTVGFGGLRHNRKTSMLKRRKHCPWTRLCEVSCACMLFVPGCCGLSRHSEPPAPVPAGVQSTDGPAAADLQLASLVGPIGGCNVGAPGAVVDAGVMVPHSKFHPVPTRPVFAPRLSGLAGQPPGGLRDGETNGPQRDTSHLPAEDKPRGSIDAVRPPPPADRDHTAPGVEMLPPPTHETGSSHDQVAQAESGSRRVTDQPTALRVKRVLSARKPVLRR